MRIIGSDYDGTLNYGGIDDEKCAAIARWRAAGGVFAIVSGRGMPDLVRLHERDPMECDFLVGNNGGVIATTDGTPIAEIRCDGALAAPLLQFLFAAGCPWCDVHTAFVVVRVHADPTTVCGAGEYTVDTLPPITYFTQISTMLETEQESATITAALEARFGDLLNPLRNGRCIDVVRADVNKAAGLYGLAAHVGATRDEIIAVGDNINDRDMIAEFYSYAMENGVDSIKALADHVTRGITELICAELGAEPQEEC